MARLPRVYIEGVLYYVTSKAGHSQQIFADADDYQEYISLINKYKAQYGFNLFSYALLPTHLHMLIELKNNIDISRIMHDINSLYTKSFNTRYGKKGHLFQERFKAALAEKESYLLQLMRHVHLNPARSKLVYEAKDYPYSSYQQYTDPSKRLYPDLRNEVEEVFAMLKGRELAIERYTSEADTKELDNVKKEIHKKRILGTKGFQEKVKDAIEQKKKMIEKKPEPPKKAQIVYLMISGFAILVLTVTIAYFYKDRAELKSTYEMTIARYEETLEMLKREREKALGANADTESFAWKIKLAEDALKAIKEERVITLTKEIEGHAWKISIKQISGPRTAFAPTDVIFFKNDELNSVNLKQNGFPGAIYSKKQLDNGNIVWETLQKHKSGETISWRGEWNGKIMKGILTRRSANGVARDFSFSARGGN